MFTRVPPRANNFPHSCYSSYYRNISANFSTKAKHITLYNALYALFYWFFGNAWFFLYFFALVECGSVNEMAFIHQDRCSKTASNMRKRLKEAGIQR